MTPHFDVVLPAVAFWTASGSIDLAATRPYAERATATWVDYFILSGSTTQGQDHTAVERAAVLDLWLDVTTPDRLLACCWERDDFTYAADRRITPMATMRHLDSNAAALTFLRGLPRGAYVYSHPMFGGAVFDAELASATHAEGVLPAGGKLAKLSTSDIAKVHSMAGSGFALWDGSSRRIRASLNAGAAGVVATPLCAFDRDMPPKDIDLIQAAVEPIQEALDALPDRASRTAELMRRAGLC